MRQKYLTFVWSGCVLKTIECLIKSLVEMPAFFRIFLSMATSSTALWVVYVSPQKCNARDFCAYVPRPGCFSFIISIESQNPAPIESNLSFRSQEHKALSITLKSKPNPY